MMVNNGTTIDNRPLTQLSLSANYGSRHDGRTHSKHGTGGYNGLWVNNRRSKHRDIGKLSHQGLTNAVVANGHYGLIARCSVHGQT
jgi:hypothetical protein